MLAVLDPAIIVGLLGLAGVTVSAAAGVLIAVLNRDARSEQRALEQRLRELEQAMADK